MADLAHSLAVAVAELGTLTVAVPLLLGDAHPQVRLVQEALGDVATGLFAATGAAAHEDPETATTLASQQLKALRTIQQLISELDPAPAHPVDLDDAVEVVCGLLELNTGPRRP